jgi:hypothetical protein
MPGTRVPPRWKLTNLPYSGELSAAEAIEDQPMNTTPNTLRAKPVPLKFGPSHCPAASLPRLDPAP